MHHPEVFSSRTICITEGTLVVLSGLPGSGKSRLRLNNTLGSEDALVTWLSTDALRDEISPPQKVLVDGKPRLQRNESANDAVFSILQIRVRAGLQAGRTVVVDATNLTDADRQNWVAIADEVGAPHLVLILDVPLETCIARAAARLAWVPEATIRLMNRPPVPVLDPSVVERAQRNGAQLVATAPLGFQRTSRFNHRVIDDETEIRFTLKMLPDGKWDIVGDVHGLYPELLLLLEQAGWTVVDGRLLPHPDGRSLLFLGDLVDRGTMSIEVLRLVKRACDDGLARCLKGNHEDKLIRFVKTARTVGIERWTSFANAETGMALLKLDERERDELLEFLLRLPAYLVDEKSRTAFVHADVHLFAPGTSRTEDFVFGMSGWKRVDSDAIYEAGFEAGINRYNVIRGHIPQTSEQAHIYSLERHPFQCGELVLLHLDQVQEVFAQLETSCEERRLAFNQALLTQRCSFDFAEYSKRYAVLKELETLVESRHVTRGFDDSKMFRVFKYSKQTFWNNAWGESPLMLKARGLALDPAAAVVSHPFDKCFNYLENGTGADLSDDLGVVAVDKLNGFLGIVSGHPLKKGDLLVHTQGGFGGEFVGFIHDYLVGPVRGQVLKFLTRNDVTLMFEVLHEKDPHIIEYPPAMLGLHLIGVRGRQLTCQPWTEEAVDAAAALMGLRRPAWVRTTFGQLRERVRREQSEGVMVREDSPTQDFLLKFKTPFYLSSKFLMRLSAGRQKHMFSNPRDFKKTLDEEFYVVVDALVSTFTLNQFLAFSDEERVREVRALINAMQ